ncbi:MAG: hypothetical protein JWM27_3849 [Gemmatimonadetes bacterium]|nr:hypothetical protein [Gemmatimonadota bacterium]
MPSSSRARLRSASRAAAPPAAQAVPAAETAGSPAAVLLRRARDLPGSLSPRDLLQLQRMVGNRAVGHLLAAARASRAEPPVRSGGGPAIQPLGHAGAVQRARGVLRYGQRDIRFPPMPAPAPAGWLVGASGPYHVPTRMEAILTPNWDHLAGGGPVNTKFFLDVAARNWLVPGLYHRGHVLADSLKGPAAEYNMVPLTETANHAMRDDVENPIREYLKNDPQRGVLRYRVDITYGQGAAANRSTPEEYLPTRLSFRLWEYQSPEDYHYLGDLAAWLANDPEPRDPVRLPSHIDVQLPVFGRPFPGVGLSESPTLESVTAARAGLRAFNAGVQNLVADLGQRGINAVSLTRRRVRINLWIRGLGAGFGISREDGIPPAVRQGVIANRLQTDFQALQARHQYLVHAEALTENILSELDAVGTVNEPDLLHVWENRIDDLWGEADNVDMHRGPWADALDAIGNLSSWAEGSYIGPNDLEGLNWELQKRLERIRAFL